ncbi:enoyl-CoA hydratase/isomerase family protein [Pseudonocardia ailaonensis]|uniref:Enoyl-CoA hydratase/isomerase family protein n=1 Tax=Pseudonocardia ailaonensis TaxID=367279 RepID=A0ABN2NB64_9PSEU
MIDIRRTGGVTVVGIEHGPVNAMDLELCEELGAALTELGGEGRPLVLTGAGKAFSAGVDLRRIVDGGEEYVRRFVPALAAMFRVAFTLPVPLVTAVNGHAIAGGAVLAAAGDTVLMADGKGRIGLPEIRVGVAFPQSAFEIILARVGNVATRRLIVGAENHTPADAQALGLVDRVVEGEKLVDLAVEEAEALGALTPPDAFAAAKELQRRENLRRIDSADDGPATDVWVRRVEDGWIARFLEEATRR